MLSYVHLENMVHISHDIMLMTIHVFKKGQRTQYYATLVRLK